MSSESLKNSRQEPEATEFGFRGSAVLWGEQEAVRGAASSTVSLIGWPAIRDTLPIATKNANSLRPDFGLLANVAV